MNDVGQILWIVTADCAMFKVSCQMKKLMRTVISRSFQQDNCISRIRDWISSNIYERSDEDPPVQQESVLRHFPELFSLEVGNCKGDILAADVEELQNDAASPIFFIRPSSKEVIVPKEGDVFEFHCADFSKNWREEVARSKHPTNFGKIPKWNRTLMWTSRETDDPDPAKQLWEQDALKSRHYFWSTRGFFFYRHQVQARIEFYMPKESSWPRGKESSRLERKQTADSPGVRNWERASTLGTGWRRKEGRTNKRPDVVPFSRRGGVPPVSRQGHRRKRRQDLLLGHWRGHHHNEKMPHESRETHPVCVHMPFAGSGQPEARDGQLYANCEKQSCVSLLWAWGPLQASVAVERRWWLGTIKATDQFHPVQLV